MSGIKNPVALVTGSGRPRVGNVIARYLADRGFRIALHYHRSEKDAFESRDELRLQGCDCEAFEADVADETDVQRMVTGVQDHFGRIDVLVTTSSIWSAVPLEEVTAESLRKNFDVNTLGTFLVARSVGQIMTGQQSGGAIITIGDWSIDRPYLHHLPYFVSKGAIPTLTRVLALELGHRNPLVRVNCIHPGPVMFPPDSSEEERQELVESTLVKRADCPDMVAHAVMFLIENHFVTGVCIPVDGGRHMHAPTEALREAV